MRTFFYRCYMLSGLLLITLGISTVHPDLIIAGGVLFGSCCVGMWAESQTPQVDDSKLKQLEAAYEAGVKAYDPLTQVYESQEAEDAAILASIEASEKAYSAIAAKRPPAPPPPPPRPRESVSRPSESKLACPDHREDLKLYKRERHPFDDTFVECWACPCYGCRYEYNVLRTDQIKEQLQQGLITPRVATTMYSQPVKVVSMEAEAYQAKLNEYINKSPEAKPSQFYRELMEREQVEKQMAKAFGVSPSKLDTIGVRRKK